MHSQKYKHICEVCGCSEILTPEEAFQAGWDYPPRMGFFGVLSPRTCPDCSLMDTVWAALVLKGMGPDDLTDAQKETLLRIVNEPDSVMPEEGGSSHESPHHTKCHPLQPLWRRDRKRPSA